MSAEFPRGSEAGVNYLAWNLLKHCDETKMRARGDNRRAKGNHKLNHGGREQRHYIRHQSANEKLRSTPS